MSSVDTSQPKLWKNFKNLHVKKIPPADSSPNKQKIRNIRTCRILPRVTQEEWHLLPALHGPGPEECLEGGKWDPCGAAAPQGPCAGLSRGQGWHPWCQRSRRTALTSVTCVIILPQPQPINKGLGVVCLWRRSCGFFHSLIQPSVVVFSHRTGTVETFGGASAINETLPI